MERLFCRVENMKQTIDKEALKQSLKDFKFHFDNSENARIIFSAPFGTGKTTFLKEFLDEKTEYVPIKLFPVNYSVASNEDIFQLIKHDILLQILGSSIDLDKIEFTQLETLSSYLPEKTNEIFENLISFIPKTGNYLIDKIKPIYKLYKDYSEYRKTIKEKNEEKEIKAFLSTFSFKEGSIYEEDLITLLIKDLLSKQENTVLIIDDLDRLDPEHVFRILNIFSAHFDVSLNENKFGFSKIILVCDIENIRTLFKHKYGLNTDFSGYIDKFYSKEIYHFTNSYSLVGWLNGITKNFKSDSSTVNSVKDRRFIADILETFIKHKKLNFRSIRKLDYNSIKPIYERLYENCDRRDFFDLHLSKVAYLLKIIFGDIETFYEKLEEISAIYKGTNSASDDRHELNHSYYNAYIFPVLTYRSHNFKSGKVFEYIDTNHNPKTIRMESKSTPHFLEVESAKFYSLTGNFWIDLKKAIKILKEAGAV